MRKMMKGMIIAVIAVSLAAGMASCGGGGDSPQGLAKQTKALYAELAKDDAFMQSEEYKTKNAELTAKIKQLSEADKKIYDEELDRLAK